MQDVQLYIEKYRRKRQSNKVLHGFPSPMFWTVRDVPVTEVMRARLQSARRIPKRVNLYVGTPYCLPTEPDRCGFCLFPSEVYKNRQQLQDYLVYLAREGEMFQEFFQGQELASVYFGGGTSNLYSDDQYAELLRLVRGVFTIPSGTEITLEGIPQLFTEQKLAAMKACGVTRISMGVQQLDDEMIKASGRKQKAAQVFRTLEWCEKLQLPCSIDLIFGWPRQTIEHMLRDLQCVVDAGVPHITHYELNVAGRTDFARHHRHELPSTEQNLEMYRVGRDFLEAHGYRQSTPYDWRRVDAPVPTSYLYEEIFRRPFRESTDGLVGFDAWGWGYAGVSFFFGTPQEPGWAYMNHVRIDDYFRQIDAGRFPVERGFQYTADDLRLHLLFQELQGMRVARRTYERLFGVDIVEEHLPIWDALTAHGWARVEPENVEIIDDGVFYTPLIQNLLAHDRMEQMRKARPPIEENGSYISIHDLGAGRLEHPDPMA